MFSAAFGLEVEIVSPESVGLSSAQLNAVDDTMGRLVEKNRLAGGVVLIARHGKVAYLKSFGLRNIESKEAMTNDTIFRIYSMTKAITSAGILQLVDDGKLGLDDPVSKYVPAFASVKVHNEDGGRKPKRPPTIRDLLRHTAGLTYGLFGNSPVDKAYKEAGVLNPLETAKVMSEKVGGLPLEYDPGTSWKYSVGIDVLGHVIEVVSGKTFGAFLQERIFEPLKMTDTSFFVVDEKRARFAELYESDGKGKLSLPKEPLLMNFGQRAPFESGGGGLTSTILDYYKFLQAVADSTKADTEFLSQKSALLMTTNQLPDAVDWIRFDRKREGVGFGLGFSVRVKMSGWDPNGRIGEYGWGGAASTHYWVSPKDDLIVVTMEQTKPYSFMTEFALKKIIYDAIEEN